MKVIFYNPTIKNLTSFDELYLSMQGGINVWSSLAHVYLKKFNYETLLLDYLIKEEAIVIFHPRFTKNLKKEKYLKNKILVATLADARNKLNFVDYHIVQNPYQVDDNSFFIPHFPQPKIIPRNMNRDIIENVSFKGEKQNLDLYFQSDDFLYSLNNLDINFNIDTKNKWRDYSNSDIILAKRPNDKFNWIKKPFTKVVNAWMGQSPIIVGSNEVAYKYLKKSELDFIEVDNNEEVIKKIKYLKNNKNLFNEIVLNGIERSKEFSVEKIIKQWIEVLEEIKTKKFNLSLKIKINKFVKFGVI